MARKISEDELRTSIERMRETVLARLEMKKPSGVRSRDLNDEGKSAQEESFTIKRLWDRLFSSGE